ncbi:MAG: hypothetical protein Ct9H300mP23_07850 [Nitrospinota bacterium]|nr:MAG: hypothetical protein Ct9H300mP23_07850 [Nitrospinota bacterium]
MPIIKQLSPLPIPNKPALSPFFNASFSTPIAKVTGKEAEPVFPKNPKVEKSFLISISNFHTLIYEGSCQPDDKTLG